MTQDQDLVFAALGGCGEVGMNLYLYGFGDPDKREWIAVDMGVKFADAREPGIDLMMADVSFLRKQRKRLRGIILTHGHEDHIGAIAHLWPKLECPVYATPFTAELMKDKIQEAGLESVFPLTVVPLSSRFELGPFSIELISVTHSIPEPSALAIRTPLGTALHTGDWKLDPDPVLGPVADEAAFTALGDEGVLAMVCDSTNVLSPGHSGSEALVRDSLTDLIGGLKGRVAVTTFASNAARLDSIARAARANGREVVLVGRAMHRTLRAARACGYLEDFPETVPQEEAGYLPPEKTLYLCTGSQGEPRAALARVAEDSHPHLVLSEGDTVIFSSKIIPGNELPIYAMQNSLAERGVHIISERDHFVHVSGHPNRDELARMYQWVRPKIVLPMHGEMRMLLEHEDFAKAHGAEQAVVAPNGTLVRLAPGAAEIIGTVPQGRMLLDGTILTPDNSPAVSMRRRLGFTGAVVVTVVLDDRGDLLDDPRVVPLGIPEEIADLADTLAEDLSIRAEEAIDGLAKRDRKSDGAVQEAVRRALRRPFNAQWGKRPLIEIEIVRLED